jgi:dsRNA-specific ribonuclease
VRLREEFDSLRGRSTIASRDRGLLEHAMTHLARTGRQRRRRRQRVARVLGDAVLGFVIVADLLFREFRNRNGDRSRR